MKKTNTESASAETKLSSDIEIAIDYIRRAQERIAAFARERAEHQLSNGSLAAMNRELAGIDRRLSVYVKD